MNFREIFAQVGPSAGNSEIPGWSGTLDKDLSIFPGFFYLFNILKLQHYNITAGCIAVQKNGITE